VDEGKFSVTREVVVELVMSCMECELCRNGWTNQCPKIGFTGLSFYSVFFVREDFLVRAWRRVERVCLRSLSACVCYTG